MGKPSGSIDGYKFCMKKTFHRDWQSWRKNLLPFFLRSENPSFATFSRIYVRKGRKRWKCPFDTTDDSVGKKYKSFWDSEKRVDYTKGGRKKHHRISRRVKHIYTQVYRNVINETPSRLISCDTSFRIPGLWLLLVYSISPPFFISFLGFAIAPQISLLPLNLSVHSFSLVRKSFHLLSLSPSFSCIFCVFSSVCIYTKPMKKTRKNFDGKG